MAAWGGAYVERHLELADRHRHRQGAGELETRRANGHHPRRNGSHKVSDTAFARAQNPNRHSGDTAAG